MINDKLRIRTNDKSINIFQSDQQQAQQQTKKKYCNNIKTNYKSKYIKQQQQAKQQTKSEYFCNRQHTVDKR